MIIHFQKKSQAEWMILYIISLAMISLGLTDILKAPSALKYTIDIAWIVLGLLLCMKRRYHFDKDVRLLVIISMLFFLFACFGYLKNFQNILYNLWGFRNNLRFFVFFFACILFLREERVSGIFKLVDVLFWVNFPLVLVQYFVMHKSRDYLGGIFGTNKGCNAAMNIFLLLVVIYAVLLYTHKRDGIKQCLIRCIIAIVIAALSELKVFFVELVLILGFLFLMDRFGVRKLFLGIGVTVCLFMGLRLVARLFPSFSGWFTVEGIMEIIADDRGYTGANDLNRLVAVSQAMERYLNGSWEILFGFGLGNCDYASFNILKTPFYQRYSSSHYVWFSSAFLVLETGIVGLGLYLSFFGVAFSMARKREKSGKADVLYCQMAELMAMMSVIQCFYNASLRTEVGYLVYFALALPFLVKNKNAAECCEE